MWELLWRPWKSAADWNAPHGLLSLRSSALQACQNKDGTTRSGLDIDI